MWAKLKPGALTSVEQIVMGLLILGSLIRGHESQRNAKCGLKHITIGKHRNGCRFQNVKLLGRE